MTCNVFKKSAWILSAYLMLFTPLATLACAGESNPKVTCGYDGKPVSDTDISGLFCPDIAKEHLYNEHNFESYKMLIPGQNGWIYRSESDMKKNFSLDETAEKNLARLDRALENNGIELVILLTPTRAMMHPENLTKETINEYKYDPAQAWKSYERGADEIRKLGIDVVTLDKPSQPLSFFYKRDHHWSPDGAKMSAQAVADHVHKMSAFKDIERVKFETHDADEYEFEGVSKKVFDKLCGTTQPPEYITRQYTEPAKETSGESALFGEAKAPEIVLVGTSNSTQIPSYANFEGYLKESIGADILNMSVSGGGLDTAMLNYLKSDFYKDNPAKIMIWEIPSYYDISNHKQFFREAIPTAFGSCSDNPVAKVEGKKLTKNSELLIRDLDEHKISGSDYYIHLKYDRPVTNPFKLDLRYNGNRDAFRFRPSNRDSAAGPYVMILRDDKKEILSKLAMWSPAENLGATVDAYICDASQQSGEQKSGAGVSGMFDKVKDMLKR